MQKYRLYVMIAACLSLVALVWLDNPPVGGDAGQLHRHGSGSAREDVGVDGAGTPVPVSTSESGAPRRFSIGNPLASIGRDRLHDMTERPLFAPSRRRPPDARAAGTLASDERGYELLGVVRNGDRAIALIRKAREGTSFRVEMGDMIGGWRVAKVEPVSVLLERGDGTALALTLNR